jgi:HK97 gp10 family phage protein
VASVWVEGVEELNKLAVDLAGAPQRVGVRGAAALRKTAHDIEATGKAFAPVDTGNLRNSITTDFAGDGRSAEMSAEIGPTVSYAPFQEYGTSRIAPRAFMGPAFDRHAPTFVEIVQQLADPLDT